MKKETIRQMKNRLNREAKAAIEKRGSKEYEIPTIIGARVENSLWDKRLKSQLQTVELDEKRNIVMGITKEVTTTKTKKVIKKKVTTKTKKVIKKVTKVTPTNTDTNNEYSVRDLSNGSHQDYLIAYMEEYNKMFNSGFSEFQLKEREEYMKRFILNSRKEEITTLEDDISTRGKNTRARGDYSNLSDEEIARAIKRNTREKKRRNNLSDEKIEEARKQNRIRMAKQRRLARLKEVY